MKTLIQRLVEAMITIEPEHISGKEKKTQVLELLKNVFDIDENLVGILDEMIDVMVLLDKNKLKIRKRCRLLCV